MKDSIEDELYTKAGVEIQSLWSNSEERGERVRAEKMIRRLWRRSGADLEESSANMKNPKADWKVSRVKPEISWYIVFLYFSLDLAVVERK